MNSKRTTTALSSLFVLAFASSASALVLPPDCATDDDCVDGQVCEFFSSGSSGCSEPVEGGCADQIDIPVAKEGYCVAAPETCQSDSDCGEYLACASTDLGSCWSSSDGTSGCSEPDPNAPKECVPASEECVTDDDCPRDFECVSEQTLCLDIACADDAPDCGCTSESTSVCYPKDIECDANADCPADWSCSGGETYRCDTDGGTDSGGGSNSSDAIEPAPGEDFAPDPVEREPAPEPTCKTVVVPGNCYPDAWGGSDYDAWETTSGGVDNEKGENTNLNGSDGDDDRKGSSESGGCSVAATGQAGQLGWLSLLLLGVPFLRRRFYIL